MMTQKRAFFGLTALACLIGSATVAEYWSEAGDAANDRNRDRSVAIAEGEVLNVRKFGAQGDGVTDDTEAIQAAWDAAREAGARVVLPPGEYLISLRGNAEQGYGPALRLSPGEHKEKQPILEGATRGVTLKISFPEGAPRTQEAILIDRGSIRDNQRGMGLRNLRLVNTTTESSGTWRDPIDYHGIGIRIDSGWTGETLHNFQIHGFHVGLMLNNWYHSSIEDGEIRNCNFGLCLYGTPNGNTFRNIALRDIRPVATPTGLFHPKLAPSMFPDGRIGAAVYAGGGTISGVHFDSVNTEMCSTAGYFFHSNPVSFTVTNMRSEAVIAPIWIQGPVGPWYTDSVTFISPSIDCKALTAPALYLNRARGYTFINPRFYHLTGESEQTAIEMTAGSLGNYVLNPLIIAPEQESRGAAATPGEYVVDEGTNNEIRWPGGATK
jgi:hypothetical protein